MASTGQVDSHAPQEMHSLEMTYAMIVLLLIGWLTLTLRKLAQYTSKNLDYTNIYTA